MSGFTKFINNLTFKQLLIWILVIIVIVVFIVLAKNYIEKQIEDFKKDKKDEEQKKKEDAVLNAGNEVNTELLSYGLSQYNQMVSELVQAFTMYGTDEEAVYNVLRKCKTKSDFLKLVEVFGIKGIYTGTLWFTIEGNLYDHLAYELDNSEKQKANQILAQIGVSI